MRLGHKIGICARPKFVTTVASRVGPIGIL